jgi:hypothetical protein
MSEWEEHKFETRVRAILEEVADPDGSGTRRDRRQQVSGSVLITCPPQ